MELELTNHQLLDVYVLLLDARDEHRREFHSDEAQGFLKLATQKAEYVARLSPIINAIRVEAESRELPTFGH